MRVGDVRPSRNTPTCVGKTFNHDKSVVFAEKHPHMRGEDSSGLIRFYEMNGNTPTCVGKTLNDH